MQLTNRVTDNQYVVFKLAEEYYGIDIYKVKIIEKLMDLTRVPNAPEYIEGVVNLRGEVVTVIDLRKRFGFEERDYDGDVRIIIVGVEDMVVGLIVDSSSEVIHLSSDQIDPPPQLDEKGARGFVNAIGKSDERLIMILDLEKVLDIKNNN